MADLLECLIQMRALAETVTLSVFAGTRVDASEMEDVTVSRVWQRMAGAERRYAAALGADAAAVAHSEWKTDATAPRVEFVNVRTANLEVLGRCSAAELDRLVPWPGRSATTVADLVAIMLAHDTEVLGQVRLVCGGLASRL